MAMERSFSVDDLVGGIWRLGQAAQAGMGRTDSEAAFQEFLKRIPSATNLAAAAASQQLDQQQQAHIQQQVQQLQQQALQQAAAVTNVQTSSSAPPASSLPPSSLPIAPSTTASNLGGLNRVPSLDFIRQLVNQHTFSQALAQSSVKPDTGSTALSLSPSDLASLSASGLTAALQAVPALSAAANPLAAAGLPPTAAAAAAAAALQLGQLGQLRLGGGSQSLGGEVKETVEKAEIRRARRMLSNRESARRSRKRKQEHLHTLEDEIKILVDDKKDWQDKAVSYERRCQLAEEENKRLKEDNQRLREEIHFLRTELMSQIVERKNGYYRRRSPDYDDNAPPKRSKSSKTASPPPLRHTPEPPSSTPKAAEAVQASDTPKATTSRHDALPGDKPAGADAVAMVVDAGPQEPPKASQLAAPAASARTSDSGSSYTSDSKSDHSDDSGSHGDAS